MATKKTKSSKTKTVKKTTAKKPAVKKSVTAKSAPRSKTVHATEPYHPAFGVVILVVCAFILAVLLPFTIKMIINPNKSDAARFSENYTLVEKNNVFKYKTAEEIIDILNHGTGIVFLGFPSCPWCQTYAKMLNDIAKEKGIGSIYYYNIHDDRENDTEHYKQIVGLLDEYLQYDNFGKKRIYVPNVTFVIDGKIVGNDWETSKDTAGTKSPEEYWTEDRVNVWKEKIAALMDKMLEQTGCESTCNE